MKKRAVMNIILLALPILLFLSFLFNPHYIDQFYLKVILLTVCILLSFVVRIAYKYGKIYVYKLLLILEFLSVVILVVGSVLNYFNLMYIFSSIANLKYFILSTGSKGMIIYILIQMAQVVFLPIPAGIITLAGVAIWGPFLGAVLDSVGVLLGSYTSFFLGKVFGFRLVSWVTGRATAEKYAKIINDRGKFFLFYAFLLPFFPDDILCLIAGITTMSFKYFFLVALITRPIGVFCLCYFGGGYIIPFSGWGLYVWIFLGIIILASIYFLTKYQSQIEEKLLNILMPKKKKERVK